MDRKIKLIWDFRGMDAQNTAKHHAIHLEEYANREKLGKDVSGVNNVEGDHWIAYIIVEESKMIPVRDSLRPQRGELA